MDKAKSKVDLRAAGKKRLEEFRQKKQSKGSHAKSLDKSKYSAEETLLVEIVTDPDQNTDSESSAICSLRLSEDNESFNKEETETAKVEEMGAEEGTCAARNNLVVGEVFPRAAQDGSDDSVDLDPHEGQSSKSAEGQRTDVAVPSNMATLTKDEDGSIIQVEVSGCSPAGDTLPELMNALGSHPAALGTDIESGPANPIQLNEDNDEKAVGEGVDVEFMTSKPDGVCDSGQISYVSSKGGVPGEGVGSNVTVEEACHGGEVLHFRRLADQEMGISEVDKQQNKDGVLQQSGQADMEGPAAMLLTGDRRPSSGGLLHDLEDEKNKFVTLERAFVDGVNQLAADEGKNMDIDSVRTEMERCLLENERLLAELGACRESLMQANEENVKLTDKLNFNHLRAEQVAVDNSRLEAKFEVVAIENITLQKDLEACMQRLLENEEHESLLRAEQNTNEELTQENAKLIVELEQLKQTPYDLEQEKVEKAFALEELRSQLQVEMEGKTFLAHELDNAWQKLHVLGEERSSLTGRIEATAVDTENARKERAEAISELQTCQLQVKELTECGTQSALELASLQHKLEDLEADKLSAMSMLRDVQDIEKSWNNELHLTVEVERFAEAAKKREEECLTKLENLRYQLQLTSDEKCGLLMQLDEQARIKMETEQNYRQVASEMAETRALIDEMAKERELLAGHIDQYKLEVNSMFMEKEEYKIEAYGAKEQIEELTVQIAVLKDELQHGQADRGRLVAELDGFKALVDKLRNETEELTQDLCLTRYELEQIKSRTELQEKLENERNRLTGENKNLLEELNQYKEHLLRIQDEQIQHENEFREVVLKLQNVTEENMHLKSCLLEHEQKLAEVRGKYLLSVLGEEERKVELQETVNEHESLDQESQVKSYDREQAAQEEHVPMQWKELESQKSLSEAPTGLLNQQMGNWVVESPQITAVSPPEASLNQVQELVQEKSQLMARLQATEQQLLHLHEKLAQAQQKLTASQQIEEQKDLQDARVAPVSVQFTSDFEELTSDTGKVIDLDRTRPDAANFERENRNLLQELDILKHCVSEMEKENASIKDDYGSVQLQLQALEDKRARSPGDICRLEEQLQKVSSDLTKELIGATHQSEKLRQENEHLQLKYDSVVKQVQDLEDKKIQLGVEINRLKDHLDDSAEVGEMLKHQLVEVQKDKAQLAVDLELTNKRLEELDVSSKLERAALLQQISEQDSDHAHKVSHLKSCLNEAELTSQKLEKAVREMLPDPSSSSKAGGKVAPGVSKLIRAFEAKAQHDDVMPEAEHGSIESSTDVSQVIHAHPLQDVNIVPQQLKETEDEVGLLRATLSQLERDADIIKQQLKEEEEERGFLTSALSHLKADVDVLKQQKNEQEENMVILIEKNEQLMAQALKDNSKIDSLQAQLQCLQEQAWEKSVTLQGQLEQLEREYAEQLSLIEAERNSSMVSMLNVAEKLEETIQHVSSKFMYDSAPSSVDLRLAIAVDATIEKIDELRNLEMKLKMVEEQRLSAVSELLNAHDRLRKLIKQQERMNEGTEEMFDRLRNVEAKEVEGDGQNSESILPLDILSADLDKFVDQFEKTLEEKIQFDATIRELESSLLTKDQDIQDHNAKRVEFEAATRELEFALATKDQDIQDLNAKCVELSKKCIENENCQKCAQLDEVRASLDTQVAQHAMDKDVLCSQLDALQRALSDQEKTMKATSEAHSQLIWHLDGITKKLVLAGGEVIHDEIIVTDSDMHRISHLENIALLLIDKYKASLKEIDLFQKCLLEFDSESELSGEKVIDFPLHLSLRETLSCKEKKLSHLREKLDEVNSMRNKQEEEMRDLREQLCKVNDDLNGAYVERNNMQTNLEQAEQKLSSVREKLSIAVSKGKGLVQQRDILKQSLAEKSNELERCWQELQKKNSALCEAETRIKLYGEAGERVEALESELAYIRNSATALRESFLLKDSVLQKIEEILEELNLPEEFHSKEIIEKIEWLARSCAAEYSPLVRDWDPKMPEREDDVDAGFQMSNPRVDTFRSNQNQEIETLRRKHEELQVKYLSLAEQSDMLEQSLLERNHLIQRWEEVLDNVDMPVSMRSMEPEDRIELLGRALSQAQQDAVNTQHQIENVQRSCDLLVIELEDSERKILVLESDLSTEKHEKEVILKSLSTEKAEKEAILELLSTEKDEKEALLKSLSKEKDEKEAVLERLKELTFKYETLTEQTALIASENEILGHGLVDLLEKVLKQVSSLKMKGTDNCIDVEGFTRRSLDTVGELLQDEDFQKFFSGRSSEYLEGRFGKLIDEFNALSEEVKMLEETDKDEMLGRITSQSKADELQSLQEALDTKDRELTELYKRLDATVASHKNEQDQFVEQFKTLSEETEAVKNQRDALQNQLEQAEQKLFSTREKLSMAVKKGKGLVQQRDSLKQSMDEKIAELEQCKGELQARNFVIEESQLKIRNLTTALERFEMLESHAANVEKALLESNVMVERLMTIIDAIDVTGDLQFKDPVGKIECFCKSFQELRGQMVSAELEIKKSKRAADMLAAELDEVHERVDNLEDELAKAEHEIVTLRNEKAAAEAAKAEAALRLEHAVAMHTEEINQASRKVDNQSSALVNVRAGLQHLRKEHDHLLHLLANDFYKKLELLKGVEGALHGILHQLPGSREFKLLSVAPIGELSHTSMNLHEEGKYLASETYPPEHADHSIEHGACGGQMADGLLTSLAEELQICMGSFEVMKERFQGQSAAFNQKVTGVSQLLQTLVEEVVRLVESLKSAELIATGLEALKQEKDNEICTLQKNITILHETCNSAVAELKNLEGQMNDIDGPNFGGHVTATADSSWLASENLQTLQSKGQVGCVFTMEYCMETAGKLSATVKDFIHRSEKMKYNQKELSTSISKLQKEVEAKEVQHSRVCIELQIQIKKAEAVANSLAKEKDMDKARIDELEKYVEILKNDYHALVVRVEGFQARETSMKGMEEKIASLHDALSTKNQEVDGLMQALDEAETQMENFSGKVEELENDIKKKQTALENLESSRGKAVAKLSSTVNRLDDLRQLSEGLLAEVESLQFQLESRDVEISRLRQEVTRCTNDILISQENMKRKNIEIQELQARMETMISNLGAHDRLLEEKEVSRTDALLGMLEKRIAGIMFELESFRVDAKSKDILLQETQNRMEELLTKVGLLEALTHDKQTEIERLQGERGLLGAVVAGPEVSEIEEVGQVSKRSIPVAPHVRSTRKVSSDQLALTIDMESGQSTSDFEDDDKGHVFKSLTTSRLIPKITRPFADRIDGIWVAGGRVLMRQPTARLGLIVYWIVLHLWMVATVV